MPPHSRAQRRRQPQRNTPRPPRPAVPPVSDEAEPLVAAEGPTVPLMPPAAEARPAPPARSARAARRPAARAPEPVDYSQDYVSARRDLTRITIISALIFAAMVALSFSGLL